MNGHRSRESAGKRNGAAAAVIARAAAVLTVAVLPAAGVPAYAALSTTPVAAACPRGVWVWIGDPAREPVTILRAAGDGRFAAVGEASAPATRAELDDRAARFTPAFPGLPAPGADELAALWNALSNGGSLDAAAVANVPVARLAAGAAWIDTTVTAGQWTYRVRRGGRDADTRPVRFPAAPGPAPAGDGTAGYDGVRVNASWPLADASAVGGVIVRRRIARRGAFEPFTGTAGLGAWDGSARAALRDDDAPVGTVVEYELTLVDRFANPGPPDTLLARTFPSDGTPVVSRLQAKGRDEGHRVRVTWELSGGAYAAALSLQRSANFDGPWETVATMEPGRREHEDVVPEANENAYYRLVVAGAGGASTVSAVVAGMVTVGEPPLPPQSVTAEPAPDGVVVTWRGEGPHLLGYRVYRALGPDGPWDLVSDLVPADSGVVRFTDPTPDLSPRFAYAYVVRAVNDAYAEGDPSDVAVASPPATEPPAAPMNLVAILDGTRVRLYWDDLSRTEPFLFGYDVFRRDPGADDFTLVSRSELAPRRNRFVDSTAAPGATVEYRVEAVDLRGARSAPSVPLAVRVPDGPGLPPPSGLRAQPADGGIRLVWDAVDPPAAGLRLVRTDAAGARTSLADLPPDAVSYTDGTAPAGATVLYTLRAVDVAGREGAPSAPVATRR